MFLRIVFCFVLCLSSCFSQIYINEVDVDNQGSDQFEFIELKSDVPFQDLTGYTLVFFNGGSTYPYDQSLSYYSFDLDGFQTDVNGIFHIGNAQVIPTPKAFFPNGTLQNGPDVIALYLADAVDFPINTLATNTGLIDAIAYSVNSNQPSYLMTILGITTCSNENLNGLKDSQSIQRKNDGTYEVKNPTPGMNNDGTGIIINYISISTNQSTYIEGETCEIVFSTNAPVENTDLVFNFTLVNGSFMVSDYSNTSGLTVLIPVGQSQVQAQFTLFDDANDEGDETMKISVANLPINYSMANNNLLVRVYDNDYQVQNYGTPLQPTYGMVLPEIPNGYYDSLEGLSGASLKQALQDIIANPLTVRSHNYGDIYEILKTADINPLNSNQVWEMYKEEAIPVIDQQSGSSNIGVWNREHIFPQSRGGFSNGTSGIADGITLWQTTNADDLMAGHADAHHIRVEDGYENSLRSNRDYGVDYNGPNGSMGSWHGDVARALFYMAVRYNGLNIVAGNPADSSVGVIGDLTTLLEWNFTDPSDDFEMNRNNYIYTWQQNRNPFIDYPSLADYIFGDQFGETWSFSLVSSNFEQNKIKVYPNPAKEILNFKGINEFTEIKIFTISNQLVNEIFSQGDFSFSIDLPKGIYLIQLKSGRSIQNQKIIVN